MENNTQQNIYNYLLRLSREEENIMFPSENIVHYLYIYKPVHLYKNKKIIPNPNDLNVNVCFQPKIQININDFELKKDKYYSINRNNKLSELNSVSSITTTNIPVSLKIDNNKYLSNFKNIKDTLFHDVKEEYINLFSYLQLSLKKKNDKYIIDKVDSTVYLTNIFPPQTAQKAKHNIIILENSDTSKVPDNKVQEPVITKIDNEIPYNEQITKYIDNNLITSLEKYNNIIKYIKTDSSWNLIIFDYINKTKKIDILTNVFKKIEQNVVQDDNLLPSYYNNSFTRLIKDEYFNNIKAEYMNRLNKAVEEITADSDVKDKYLDIHKNYIKNNIDNIKITKEDKDINSFDDFYYILYICIANEDSVIKMLKKYAQDYLQKSQIKNKYIDYSDINAILNDKSVFEKYVYTTILNIQKLYETSGE